MPDKVLNGNPLLVRNPDVILREEDPDGALLFNPDTNQIRMINTTGLFIWKQCDGKNDLSALLSALEANYEDVPEKEIEKQVKDFLIEMKANGFIGEIVGNP